MGIRKMKFFTSTTKCLIILALISSSMGAFLKRKATTSKLVYELPATVQTDPMITLKAKSQVIAARALFTSPNAKTQEILHLVATVLKSIWASDNIRESERANAKGFNRSINGGVWDGKGTSVQASRIGKVAGNVSPTPFDKAGVIAILGDIGTAIFDCEIATDPNGHFCSIAKNMATKTSMSTKDLLAWAKKSQGCK